MEKSKDTSNKNHQIVVSFVQRNKHIVEEAKKLLDSTDNKVFRPVVDITDRTQDKLKSFKNSINQSVKKTLSPAIEASLEVTGGAEKSLKGIKSTLHSIDKGVFSPLIEITGGEESKLKPIQEKLKSLDNRIISPAIEFVDKTQTKIKEVQQNLLVLGNTVISPVIEIAEGVSNTVKGAQESLIALKNVGSTGVEAFNNVKNAVSSFNLGLATMKVKMAVATAAQWLFNAALWANPVTWIVIGVIALIGAIVLLIKNWDRVRKFMAPFFDWIKNAFVSVGNWITKNWKKIITTILVFLGPLGWGIMAIIAVIRANWNSIKETTLAIWNSISTFFANLWNGIKDTAQSCWNWIGEIINGVSKGIEGAWSAVFNWFSDKFTWVKGLISEILNNPVFEFISGGVKGALDIAGKGLNIVGNGMNKGITNISNLVFGKDTPPKLATGLSYVPFDGYIAELHKGERVMTASENRAYSNPRHEYKSKGANGGGNTFNITINGVNKSTSEIINDLVTKISEAINTMGEVVYE